jgi:hypothetical protein
MRAGEAKKWEWRELEGFWKGLGGFVLKEVSGLLSAAAREGEIADAGCCADYGRGRRERGMGRMGEWARRARGGGAGAAWWWKREHATPPFR